MKIYEFAILRYRHDVITEEFINIGLVLFSEKRVVLYRITNNHRRAALFFNGMPIYLYKHMLAELERSLSLQVDEIVYGRSEPTFEEFRKALMGNKEGCIIWSDVKSGVGEYLSESFDRLYARYVGMYETEAPTFKLTNIRNNDK